MKIKLKDKTVFIADNSPIAKKIVQGFDFSIDENNNIIVQTTTSVMGNKYQLARAVQTANSVPEIKAILLKLIALID